MTGSPDKGVCVFYTGGTIGMTRGPRGWRPAPSFGALVKRIAPELFDAVAEVVEDAPPVDSSNAGAEVWYRIGRDVMTRKGGFAGFLAVYGTDTMAYAAASLSLQLAGLDAPVAVTGSMRPMAASGSDGVDNLRLAIDALTAPGARGTSVCFGGRTMHGARCRKVHATAFEGVRDVVEMSGGEALTSARRAPDAWTPGPPARDAPNPVIGVFPLHPGLTDAEIRQLAERRLDGLIIECFGTGGGPTANGRLQAALEALGKTGVAMVAISQCLHGEVVFDAYEAGAAFADAGVASGGTLTREAAFAKLHLILSHGLRGEEALERMAQDVCGEGVARAKR